MKTFKVSEIIALLDAGKGRAEIREELGLTHAEITALFQHPSLKGKKPRKPVNINVIDDLVDDEVNTEDNHSTTEVVEEVSTNSSEVDEIFNQEEEEEVEKDLSETNIWDN